MSLEGQRDLRIPERWFEVGSTIIGLLVVATLCWLATQMVGARDDIHTLKDQLPAVTQRLDRLESRVDKLDDEARERAL